MLAIVAAEKLLKIVPEGTHEHDKFIRPSTLINWAESYGLKVRAASGIHYNPIGQTFTLTKDVSVNYVLHFEKLV